MISSRDQTDKYLQNSKKYYTNSLEHYQQNNFPKASECLWGAIAEALKAMSLKSLGQPLRSHYDIRKYMTKLVGLTYSLGFTHDLKNAVNELHTYFYETDLSDHDFRLMYSKGKTFYGLLQPLLYIKSLEYL